MAAAKLTRLALTTALLGLAAAAHAGPVGVDGAYGSEWTGVTATVVGYDANSAVSNFGTPGLTNSNVGYSVYYRADSNYLYGLLVANGNTNGLNFANLYFNTDLVGGSDFGIEVTNNRAFNPGVDGYFDLSSYLTVAQSSGDEDHAIEFALSWSYFNDNPNGFLPAGTDSANGIQLRTSQSFGYSAVGGDMDPQTFAGPRFGTVAQAANDVPEPGSLALGAIGLLAAYGVSRRAKKAR